MDEYVPVTIDGKLYWGRKCTYAEYRRRRHERLLAEGRLDIVTVDEMLSRHADRESGRK